MSIEVGLKGRAETTVVQENTAGSVGSGLVPVFATPCMIALMEQAAADAIQPCLGPDEGSVGTHLDVSHDAAEVTAVEGRKITFAVTAFDQTEMIGRGTHERFVIKPERFLDKVQAKLEAIE